MAKVLHGDAGGNQLNVSADKTQVYGLKGNDTLISDGKKDVMLIGGSGDDRLIMTGGTGTLSGGAGSDVFEFTYSEDKTLSAVIEDLEPSKDKIVVKFDGNTAPQLTSTRSGNDVVWSDGDNFKITLKSVRDNDYFDDEADEKIWEVLELTNAEREAAGLSPLTMSQGLTAAASIRAKEITTKGKLGVLEDHTRLDKKTSFRTVFNEVGKSYSNVGENLDGGARTPEDVINDWITSKKGHREILLGANYKKIGVGYNEDDPDPTDRRFYWTQEFAGSLSSDSLGNPKTVTAANLLTANIAKDTVSKFIAGTNDAETIENSDYGMTISAHGGNDSISNSGLNVSISGGADFDTIENSGSFGTINAGTGNDSISLSSDTKEVLIEYTAGDGSDTIVGFNATDTIKISDIEYTPEILGDDIILTVGDDSITFLGSASIAYDFLSYIDGYWTGRIIINENNYQNKFKNDMAGVTIQARSGNNTISNGIYGEYVSIECGAGDDSILNNGTLATVNSGAGNDSVSNYGGSGASINTGAGNDNIVSALGVQVTIDSGEGSDTIENRYGEHNARISINAGSSNDSIGNYGKNATIVAGTGNDTIVNWSYGTESTLLGDEGNDYINNFGASVSIDGGTGNDNIWNNGASKVTLDGGGDNDHIDNEGDQASIYGGNDKDTIQNSGSSVTISGGKGNDRIELSTDAQNNVIEYNEGDGIDEVWGFNATDKLRIGGGTGTYYPETINGHIFINVGTGYVALANAEGLSVSDVVEGVIGEPVEEPRTIYLSEYAPDYTNTLDNVILQVWEDDYTERSIANSGSLVSIIPGESYNTITSSGDNVKIFGDTEGSNKISNTGDNVTIDGNYGSDSVANEGNNVQIDNLSYGLDTVNNSGNNVLILGSHDKDTIVNSGDNVYILGWMGNDIIELSGDAQNNTIAYQQGNDHDTVRGFNETDNLLVYVVSSYSMQTVDNNIVIDVNNGYGSVTLEDAATLEHANIIVTRLNGNSITFHVENGSVTFEGAGTTEGNNIIFGEGDDSYSNEAANMFLQALGGNDTIMNTADNVTVDLGADKDFVISQGNNGSIAGGDGDDLLVSTGDFDATIDGGSGNDEIHNYNSNGSIDGGAGDDTIENWGNDSTIAGGEGNDSIENRYGNSLIDLGEGNNILWNHGNNVTIVSGSGNNNISNYGDSVKITTGDGDDTLWNGGDNATINTSGGNDSVFNSASNTTIDLGTGNDFLHNRGDNVSILMNDGDDTVRTDAANVTINASAGNDRITLESGVEGNLIQYNVGDGDDTIWGLTKDNAKLQLGDGHVKYSTVASGDDILVKVGKNTITLKDFRAKPEHIIIGESSTSSGTNSSGSGNSSSSGNGSSSGQSGGNTSGGTSSSEGNTSDASGGLSATAGVSASNNSGTSSGRGRSSRRINTTTTPSTSTTSTTPTSSTAPATPAPATSSADTSKISLNAPTYANNPSGDEVVALIQSGDESFKKLWGSEENDTLYGGEGVDIFIGSKNQGSLTFRSVSAEDIVYLSDVSLNDLSGIKKDNDMVTFSLKTGNTFTIQSTDTVSGAIVLSDLTVHFTHPPKP